MGWSGQRKGPGPLMLAACLLWLAAGAAAQGTTLYVSQSGACTPQAPPGAECSTLHSAFLNQRATKLVLLEDVHLNSEDWADGCAPCGRGAPA